MNDLSRYVVLRLWIENNISCLLLLIDWRWDMNGVISCASYPRPRTCLSSWIYFSCCLLWRTPCAFKCVCCWETPQQRLSIRVAKAAGRPRLLPWGSLLSILPEAFHTALVQVRTLGHLTSSCEIAWGLHLKCLGQLLTSRSLVCLLSFLPDFHLFSIRQLIYTCNAL